MTEPTIQTLLDQAAKILADVSDTPLLDAEVLLCHCLQKNRTYLRAWPERRLELQHRRVFHDLIDKRQQGIPVAYIIGNREFWSRNFAVSADVLIPRPDTELLIELCLSLIPSNQPGKLIDLGTGSGAIAVTLAAERPLLQVTASDQSTAALNIARANAKRHRISNIRFVLSDWFAAIDDDDFNFVISNPPYIAADDPHLLQGDVRHEPAAALIAEQQGLKDIQILLEQSRRHLTDNGHILIEHGYNQQQAVQDIFHAYRYRQIHTHLDLSNHPRVTSGIWQA